VGDRKLLAALKIVKEIRTKKTKSPTLSGFAGERKVAGGIENDKRSGQMNKILQNCASQTPLGAKKLKILLDKSFIQGTPKSEFQIFLNLHECYLNETAFYELLTTDRNKRISAFSKLIKLNTRIKLVNNVGAFLRYENSMKKPCQPDNVLVTESEFCFNPKLILPEFKLCEKNDRDLAEWKEVTNCEINGLIELTSTLPEIFPELNGFVVGSKPGLVEKIEQDLTEEKFLLKVFAFLIPQFSAKFPSANLNWATVRWIQIKLIACLEIARRYGLKPSLNENSKKIENIFHDFSQLLPAAQIDGIATNDKYLRKIYKMIKKSGEVYP